MKLKQFAKNYILLAEDSGGPTGGGGGNAAPPDAPAVSSPGDTQVAEFIAPDLGNIGDDVPEMPGAAPIEKPPEKPGEKKVEPKPPEPKKQHIESPAKQLRDELDRVKAERDDFKTKFDKHPRVAELDATLQERIKENEALKGRLAQIQEELTAIDPSANEAVVKLADDFNAEYARAIELVPGIEPYFKELVGKFEALPRTDRATFAKALEALEGEIDQIVGERKTPAAIDLIRKATDFRAKHAEVSREVRANAGKIAFESHQKKWSAGEATTKQHLETAFKIEDDFREAHPFHPLNFVLDVRGTLSDDEKLADREYESKVDRFITFAANGVSPKTAAEWEALPAKDKTAKLQAVEERRGEAAKYVRYMAKRGAFYERILPGLLADYAKLRDTADKKSKGNPPDPTKAAGTESGNVDALEDFKTPEIPG